MPRTTTSPTALRKGFQCHITEPPIQLLLQRHGLFRHPHAFIKGIVAHPIDSFQKRSQFENLEVWHVGLSVAHCNFDVDPDARSESCTHPNNLFTLFFIPTSNSVRYCSGIRELRCCLHSVAQIQFVHQKLRHDVFSRELSSKKSFFFFPFL